MRGSSNSCYIRLSDITGGAIALVDSGRDNLSLRSSLKKVNHEPGKEVILRWKGKTLHPDEPWVAIITTDNDQKDRIEIAGSAWEKE